MSAFPLPLSQGPTTAGRVSCRLVRTRAASHQRFQRQLENIQAGLNQPKTRPLLPPDAFEVVLLEAGTMTPLAGIADGLTQTDSLINIQHDGTIFTAPSVTVIPLATGPSPLAWSEVREAARQHLPSDMV